MPPGTRTTGAAWDAKEKHATSEDVPFIQEDVEDAEEANQELIRDFDREDWIRRAHESEAASWIETVLNEHATKGRIDGLKRETFDAAYVALGDETLPEDVKRVLVVKTERYQCWEVYLFKFFTCGLFNVFRPRDNEVVLALTKKERVLMYKVERVSFFANFCQTFKTLLV